LVQQRKLDPIRIEIEFGLELPHKWQGHPMQAGRWKTTAMPMRYGEDIQAERGGMARTAKAQGRAR